MRVVPWREMAARIGEWDALAARAIEPNPFFESWYLLPSQRALDGEGRVRMLALELDGQLVGLMPIEHSWRYYSRPIPQWRNWTHANCFLGSPLVAPGAERAFWRALLNWADTHAGSGLFLHLGHIPLQGVLYDALSAVLADGQRASGVVHREDRAMLCSGETPEAYFAAALSGKKRKELRRQFNRLSDEGEVSFARQLDDSALADWTDEFLQLEASGWKGKAGSALASDIATASLLRKSLAGAAAHGRLERLTLFCNRRPIAMLASFLTTPGAFSFKTAFDENFARFSPGVMLQVENLAILDRPDIAWVDSCATADHPMIDHIWRERRAIGRVSIAIGGAVRRRVFGRLLKAELGRNPSGLTT